MPDIQPISSEDTGLSVWVPIAVVVGILALVSVPATYLIRELTEVEIGAPEPSADSGPETRGNRIVNADTILTADHKGSIAIGADNITLDCAGHTIEGSSPDQEFGVNVYRVTGVTVTNCRITKVQNGIQVGEADANTFSNNTVTQVNTGITIRRSDNNTIARNQVIDARNWFGYGLFQGSADNLFENNHASGIRGVAFMADSGEGNRFVGNGANDSRGIPFSDHTTGSADSGTANFYEDNVCANNSEPASPADLCS